MARKRQKKHLKIKQSRQIRVYLGFLRPKTGTARFRTNGRGFVGCDLDLILECTLFLAPSGPGIPVFGRCPCFFVSYVCRILSPPRGHDLVVNLSCSGSRYDFFFHSLVFPCYSYHFSGYFFVSFFSFFFFFLCLSSSVFSLSMYLGC